VENLLRSIQLPSANGFDFRDRNCVNVVAVTRVGIDRCFVLEPDLVRISNKEQFVQAGSRAAVPGFQLRDSP
jgi:hypothetical protein